MTTTLPEHRSKELLTRYGVEFLPERVVNDSEGAARAGADLGTPLAIKLTGDGIAHKTERGLVRLDVSPEDAAAVASELLDLARPEDGEVAVLIAPMVRATREFIIGTSIDPTFGPVVVFGVGGVLAEALDDAVVRLVPLSEGDAHEMIADLRTRALLDEFRGEPAVDRALLAGVILGVAEAMRDEPDLVSIDLNPVAIVEGRPIALDALCVMGERVS